MGIHGNFNRVRNTRTWNRFRTFIDWNTHSCLQQIFRWRFAFVQKPSIIISEKTRHWLYQRRQLFIYFFALKVSFKFFVIHARVITWTIQIPRFWSCIILTSSSAFIFSSSSCWDYALLMKRSIIVRIIDADKSTNKPL